MKNLDLKTPYMKWPTKRWWSLAIRFNDVSDRIKDVKTRIIEGGGTQTDLNNSDLLLRLEMREMILLKEMAADRKMQILKSK